MEAQEIMKLIQEKLATSYQVKNIGQAGIAIKDVDMAKRTVTGFFNSFNFFDSDFDVLLMGSSKRSIDQRGPESDAVAKIKHAKNHDLRELPGRIDVLEEKTIDGISGIYFETFMTETTLGNDTLINYQEKVFDNHSIGFRYKQIELVEDDTDEFDRIVATLINPEDAIDAGILYVVKEIELFEGSTVAFGANKLTPYLGVKSENKEQVKLKLSERVQLLHKQLRSGIQSDETMKNFEIQLLQLDQMIKELDFGPSVKDTLLSEARSDTHDLSPEEAKAEENRIFLSHLIT